MIYFLLAIVVVYSWYKIHSKNALLKAISIDRDASIEVINSQLDRLKKLDQLNESNLKKIDYLEGALDDAKRYGSMFQSHLEDYLRRGDLLKEYLQFRPSPFHTVAIYDKASLTPISSSDISSLDINQSFRQINTNCRQFRLQYELIIGPDNYFHPEMILDELLTHVKELVLTEFQKSSILSVSLEERLRKGHVQF